MTGTFNDIFSTNYGFLREQPVASAFFDLLGPWPWCIASAAALSALLFVFLYLPWAAADCLRRTPRLIPASAELTISRGYNR
jgi:uncharacterized membrane protein YwaF